MTTKSLLLVLALLLTQLVSAQTEKQRIYGEVGLGFGQTTFGSSTKSQLRQALGGSFNPGIVGNSSMAFYYAPESWKGLGIGSRIKGAAAGSVIGEFGDSYFFNYYNLSASAKYYAISKTFNKGWYVRANAGFGQLTTKRANEKTDTYVHQFAIGSTYTGGIGYTVPFQKTALSLEVEAETSSRSGTVNGVGDVTITNGQIGMNLIWSF